MPPLWRSELRNVLAGQVRRGAMDLLLAQEPAGLTEAMLRDSGYAVDSRAILARAPESGCTTYDYESVVLEELGVRLVTADKQVLAAFPDRAVALEDYAER